MTNEKEKINLSALFRIGYGLYVLTTNDGRKDNGCIVNSVMQVTNNPLYDSGNAENERQLLVGRRDL